MILLDLTFSWTGVFTNCKPAKFSGIHCKEEDMLLSSNQIKRNNMHFRIEFSGDLCSREE